MSKKILLKNLVKSYDNGFDALKGISLTINAGEVFGFLGPNGAGKTTTIKLLLGFMKETSGRVEIAGMSPCLREVRKSLGYLPEEANYYDYLNVRELLTFYGKLCGMSKKKLKDRIEEVLEVVGLSDVTNKSLKQFSKGMRQRAGIAQAILHDPDVLILDEPMTGLDPIGRRQIRDIIFEQRNLGKTVFFSSHELSEAEMVCDRVAILNNGKICWCGKTTDLAGDGKINLERVFLDVIKGDK